jgi:hypothetical protein
VLVPASTSRRQAPDSVTGRRRRLNRTVRAPNNKRGERQADTGLEPPGALHKNAKVWGDRRRFRVGSRRGDRIEFPFRFSGWWLSLAERCVRDAEVAGSNPAHPTRSEGISDTASEVLPPSFPASSVSSDYVTPSWPAGLPSA